MTIDEMVDEWSRMTPTQREFCARLVEVAVRNPLVKDASGVLNLVVASPLTEDTKKLWDAAFWPFKFGVSV